MSLPICNISSSNQQNFLLFSTLPGGEAYTSVESHFQPVDFVPEGRLVSTATYECGEKFWAGSIFPLLPEERLTCVAGSGWCQLHLKGWRISVIPIPGFFLNSLMRRIPSHEQINNKSELTNQRKLLRNHSTSAEAILWLLLKDKQLEGRKFRRQHSVGKYILDFYCPSEKVAVELDGEPHFTEEGKKYDEIRTNYINGLNIRIIRFENSEIFDQPETVLADIKKCFTRS